MTHTRIRNKFLDIIESTLSEKDKQLVMKHLESCKSCKLAFDDYKEIVSAEKHIAHEQHELSPAFSVTVMDEVEGCNPSWVRMFDMIMNFFGKTSKVLQGRVLEYSLSTMVVAVIAVISITFLGSQRKRSVAFSGVGSSITGNFATGVYPMHTNDAITKPVPTAKPRSIYDTRTTQRGDDKHLYSNELKGEKRVGANDESTRTKKEDALQARVERDFEKHRTYSAANTVAPEFLFDQFGPLGKSTEEQPVTEPRRYNRVKSPQQHYQIPYSQPTPSNEVYGRYKENPRTLVSIEPLSTFSIDVDTGSYSNMRRYLSMGKLPPPDSVRIEEYINYFSYDYPSQSEEPFGVNYEIAPSPLEPERYLLRLGIKARDAIDLEDSSWNLVFLADISGSMNSDDKIGLLKRTLKVLANNMRSHDRLAIVTYANSARVHLESTTGNNKHTILSAIEKLNAGGGTNGSAGIDMAYSIAKKHLQKGGINRVILATDGDFNVGTYSFDGLMNLIEQKRKIGITLTTLGFGTGNIKEKNMEQLADKGNGNYFYIDSFKEARKVLGQGGLASNMITVAKDVKLQVEFNPEQVIEYRLIGYDNRKLNTRDFNNDQIDAGEIGSGHTVTAVYEIVLANSPLASKLKTELRYQQSKKLEKAIVPEKVNGELAFVKIRYKQPKSSKSTLIEYPILKNIAMNEINETSEGFRLAAAVVYFGQLLRQSAFAGDYTFSDIAKLIDGAISKDPQGLKREFKELVENAQAIK